MTRRVVLRDVDGLYCICGLIDDATQQARSAVDDGEGNLFKLAAVTDRYVLYVPDVPVPVAEPDLSSLPDAWLPFTEHGVMTPWLAQP